jgi:hypothetical protein
VPSWARYDIWNIGIATLDRPPVDVGDLLPLRNVRWLPPQPALHLLADPFPYRHDGRDWLLAEGYGHPRGVRGRIVRIDPDDPISAAPAPPAIVRAHHVSYPCTFSDGERTYCAPEMSQEDGCAIYALGRDGGWTPALHVLRGTRIVDPTIFRFDGRWWLFGAEPPPSHTSVLNAYYADALDGPWTPHGRNPIKRDVASARPGGRPFFIRGRVYRPAQDCSATYGGALHVMEILALTPTEFEERVALRLEPQREWPYPDGLHHLVVDGARIYFDAKRTHVDWLLWLKTRGERGQSPRGDGLRSPRGGRA